MPKVTYEHLEKVRKVLVDSNKMLNTLSEALGVPKNDKIRNTIQKNNKAIEMLDDEYLDIKA
jgi:hypothetical protein